MLDLWGMITEDVVREWAAEAPQDASAYFYDLPNFKSKFEAAEHAIDFVKKLTRPAYFTGGGPMCPVTASYCEYLKVVHNIDFFAVAWCEYFGYEDEWATIVNTLQNRFDYYKIEEYKREWYEHLHKILEEK